MLTSDSSGGEDVAGSAPVALAIPGLTSAVLIGEGGFGQVYRAHQASFSRDVAVKVSRAPLHEATPRLRFERECRAMGMLSAHPNIVTVYESGFTGNDLPYLIMEFAARGSLADELDRDHPFEPAEVLSLGVRLAGALATAHQAGVLHRDIKPENVLVSSYGEPKLADFGLARLRDAPTTQSQQLTASLQHVPPELLQHGQPTEAGDICSLGSTLFELVSGRPPYWRDGERSIEPLIRRTSTERPPDLREQGVPAPLAEVIAQALDRDPAARPTSARALGEALQEAQRALGYATTRLVIEHDVARIGDVLEAVAPPAASERNDVPPAVPPAEPTPTRSRRRALLAAGVLTAIGLGVAATLSWPGANDSTASPASEGATAADSPAETAEAVATGETVEASSTTLDPEAAALLDFGSARYDPGDGFCQNEPRSSYEENDIRTLRPTEPESPGGSVTLGLDNRFASFPEQRLETEVTALVLAPDGEVATASAELSEEQVEVLYPESFTGGSTDQTGVYTVLWRDAEGNHILCSGFELA